MVPFHPDVAVAYHEPMERPRDSIFVQGSRHLGTAEPGSSGRTVIFSIPLTRDGTGSGKLSHLNSNFPELDPETAYLLRTHPVCVKGSRPSL